MSRLPRRVTARAPTRIDLAGGTLDLWPIHLLVPEAVTVNVAINLYAEVEIERTGKRAVSVGSVDQAQRHGGPSLEALRRRGALPLLTEVLRAFDLEYGVAVTTDCRAPAGSGIGGSSALAVALVAAAAKLTGKRLTKRETLSIAKSSETRVIRVPTGDQDYIAAIHGGLSAIWYEPAGTRVESLGPGLRDLDRSVTLVYTGKPHRSGINNWEVYRRFIDGNPRVNEGLARIGRLAAKMVAPARRGDWRTVGRLAGEEGALRAGLWHGIATPTIRRLTRRATELGAWGVKVCGAGGGGCVAILHPARKAEAIREAVDAQGLERLDVRLVRGGVRAGAP